MAEELSSAKRLQSLFNQQHGKSFGLIETNLKIGEIVYEKHAKGGDEAVLQLHSELAEGKLNVRLAFLFDAMRVYDRVRNADNLRAQDRAMGGIDWSFVVWNCAKAPEPGTEAARIYWTNLSKRYEDTFGHMANLAGNMDSIPEEYRDQFAEMMAQVVGNGEPIKRVPEGPFRIGHTGDTQFWEDMAWAGRKIVDPKTGKNIRLLDQYKCFDFVGQEMLRRGCWLAIHGGDLHEFAVSMPNEQGLVRSVVGTVAARIPFVFVPGNHDLSKEPKDATALEYLKGRPNVFVEEAPVILYQEGLTVSYKPSLYWMQNATAKIFCLPFPSKSLDAINNADLSMEELNEKASRELALILEGFRAEIDPKVPNILIAHITVEGAEGAEHDMKTKFNPRVRPEDLRGFDYVALDHLHAFQQVADNAWYSGSHERQNFTEENEEKGFIVATFEGRKPEVEFVPTPARKFQTLEPGFFGNPDWKTLVNDQTIYRVKGVVTREEAADLRTAIQAFPYPIQNNLVVQDAVRVRDESMTTEISDIEAVTRVLDLQVQDPALIAACIKAHGELVAEEEALRSALLITAQEVRSGEIPTDLFTVN